MVLIRSLIDANESVSRGVVIIVVTDINGTPYAVRNVSYNDLVSEYALGFNTNGIGSGEVLVKVYVVDSISGKNLLTKIETFKLNIK